ncbi:Pentatricopeptide repeat-containing protein [Abeliophyllum distichum]|uniref:Pentatricopeptide repeat-containing protein n=1 Tax=Abeliophyllum distichum TaxID=126358 RepID=A0ABD1TE04_9LAMI
MFHHVRALRLLSSKFISCHIHTQQLPFLSATVPPQWWRTTDILLLCAAAQTRTQTQQIHAQAILHGHLPRSVSISSALILSYANFYSHPCTLNALFSQTLPFSRSAFLHNTLIRAYTVLASGSQKNFIDAARGFLIYNDLFRNPGFPPDDHTFPYVLKLCADFLERAKGLEVHGMLIKSRFNDDVFVNNTLLLFYGNCGDLESVEKLFYEMPERDLITWNTVIRVFSDNGCWLETVELFKDLVLVSGLRPNVVTVVSVLPVCAGLGDENLLSSIHCYVLKVGLDGQVRVGNALVDAYGKCGNVEASKGVFDEMIERNVVSWNAIIGGFAYRGFNIDALDSFRLMINGDMNLNSITIATMLPALVELRFFNEGREVHGFSIKMGVDSDVFVANALIDMYGKWGCFTRALNVFHKMATRNVVSWNSMIGNFAQNGRELEAIELVTEMHTRGEIPNSVTLTNVLPACARLGSLRQGKEIHARSIRKCSAFELFVSNALTDMYAKCGCLDLAQNVFDISLRDEVSYNILITGYSQTSECHNSLSLFTEMEMVGMKQDIVSYMGVLAASANISAIREGKQIHAFALRRLFHEHLFVANSLIDFYIKCGRINIARKVFDRIPLRDAASWNTMILGFGMLGEVDTAINLFEAMKEDNVEYDSVSYIAVLSACSHGGLVEKGERIL